MAEVDNSIQKFRYDFGRNVRAVREKAKLTQAKLAEMVGLSTTSISELECGGKGTMLENAAKIANALGVSLNYLCGDQDTKQLQPPKIKLETLADLQGLFDLICDHLDFCDILLEKDLFEDGDDAEDSADIYLLIKDVPQLVNYCLDYRSIKKACMPIPTEQANRILQAWKTAKMNDLESTKLTDHDFPF